MNHNLMLGGRFKTRLKVYIKPGFVQRLLKYSELRKDYQTLTAFQNALIIYKNLEEANKRTFHIFETCILL